MVLPSPPPLINTRKEISLIFFFFFFLPPQGWPPAHACRAPLIHPCGGWHCPGARELIWPCPRGGWPPCPPAGGFFPAPAGVTGLPTSGWLLELLTLSSPLWGCPAWPLGPDPAGVAVLPTGGWLLWGSDQALG